MQGVLQRNGLKRKPLAKSSSRTKPSGGTGQTELPIGVKKRSFLHRWSAAGLILLASILAVLFVANAIHVNELLRSVTSIEGERDDVKRENEQLRGELTRLMSVEQITERAAAIGMVQPERPPIGLSSNVDDQGLKK